jgi:DNA mismatch repair protein MutH
VIQRAYDPSSPLSIFEYSKLLSGKSLSQVLDTSDSAENRLDKGDLGALVEKLFFKYPRNSSPLPDFPEAGVELKTSGVKRTSEGGFAAKERLVLSMINFIDLPNEEWESASFRAKCNLMLILFYLYEKDISPFDLRFTPGPVLFSFPEEDLKQLQLDWETIREKVSSGRAHELSEGDTFYLGACRKGSGGTSEPLKRQPYSEVGAKARAFSLKVKYVNKILKSMQSEAVDEQTERPLRQHEEGLDFETLCKENGIEVATKMRFGPYIGKSEAELSNIFDLHKKDKNPKNFNRSIVIKILGGSGAYIPELDAAGIEIKTIRTNENLIPKESMSFPAFKYLEIIEEEWEDSSFYLKLERRFLFVVFRKDPNGISRLEKVGFWNMPYIDRLEARRVWEETKRKTLIDASNLPKSGESRVAHVRPHARDASDTLPTPQGTQAVKKSFWLNRGYIQDVIKSL